MIARPQAFETVWANLDTLSMIVGAISQTAFRLKADSQLRESTRNGGRRHTWESGVTNRATVARSTTPAAVSAHTARAESA